MDVMHDSNRLKFVTISSVCLWRENVLQETQMQEW